MKTKAEVKKTERLVVKLTKEKLEFYKAYFKYMRYAESESRYAEMAIDNAIRYTITIIGIKKLPNHLKKGAAKFLKPKLGPYSKMLSEKAVDELFEATQSDNKKKRKTESCR